MRASASGVGGQGSGGGREITRGKEGFTTQSFDTTVYRAAQCGAGDRAPPEVSRHAGGSVGCHGSQQMTGPACDICLPLCWYDFFLPVPMSVSHGADILQAYADGADFFYMVNDDLLLLTHGWADRFVQGDFTKSRNALRAHVQCVGSSWSVYTRCRRCPAKKKRPSSNAHGASSIRVGGV